MRLLLRFLTCALALVAASVVSAGAQTRKTMLPYDHIHLNEPATHGSVMVGTEQPGCTSHHGSAGPTDVWCGADDVSRRTVPAAAARAA